MKKAMRNLILGCLTLTMVFSLTACGGKANEALPRPEERIEAIKANKITEEEATAKGWFADEVLRNGRLKGVNAFPETFFVDKSDPTCSCAL